MEVPCKIEPCTSDYLFQHFALVRLQVYLTLARYSVLPYSHIAYFAFILILSGV